MLDLRHSICDDENMRFFERAYNDYFAKVVTYVYGYYPDKEIARNIVQDTFIAFWQHLSEIDRTKTVLPFLLTVSKNKILNHIKKDKVSKKYINHYLYKELEYREKALELSTMEHLDFVLLEEKINYSLLQMTPNVREVFKMSRYENLKYEEIALALGISVKTVESRISVALRIIRKYLRGFTIFCLFMFIWG